jgi:hypothetical protein
MQKKNKEYQMKTYIFAALSTLGLLTTQVRAEECIYKNITNANTVYVVPLYKATVNFVFEKKENKAFAQVLWGLDEDKTRECLTEGRVKYPISKIVISSVRMDSLKATVMGGNNSAAINVYPEANGHWHGETDLIRIPYSYRNQIELAIQNGQSVINIAGDLRYRMTIIERKQVSSVDCTEKDEEAGVLNLFKRFKEIKTTLENRNVKEAINVEEVMQEFLGTCVVFQNVDSNSLQEFESALRINSRLVKGVLNFKGNVVKEITESLPAVSIQHATILDI